MADNRWNKISSDKSFTIRDDDNMACGINILEKELYAMALVVAKDRKESFFNKIQGFIRKVFGGVFK